MNYINTIAITIAIIATAFMGYSTGQKWLKNSAIDECNKLAVAIKDGDYVKPLYLSCMQEKGYEVVTK